MGRQIGFYMTEQDEQEFLSFVRSTGDVVIVPQASESKQGEEFATFRSLAGRRLGDACFLWNRAISPQPTFESVPEQKFFFLDFLNDEVIESSMCKLEKGKLSMGRLYIEVTIFKADGTSESKGVDFIKWYENLTKWIKKRFPKRYKGAYLSPRAEVLAQSGIELVGHRL